MKTSLLQNHVVEITSYLHISRKIMSLWSPLTFVILMHEASLCVDFQKYMSCTLDSIQQALPVQ